MIDLSDMKKKTDFSKSLTIEIINHYLVVRSLVYGITVSVGKFDPYEPTSKMPSTDAIGRAVYKVLIQIQDKQVFEQKPLVSTTMIKAAEILGISVSTVRRLIESGHIECEKTKGAHRKPYLESVYRYKNLNPK